MEKEMPEISKSIRYRVNVSQTSTGKKSWACTCDGEGFTLVEILMESDNLVEQLEKRYPPVIEVK